MKVATFNDCKVYNLSAGKTMPQWLSDSKRRSLLKDDEYRQRLELIQDFEMTVASQCIKMTRDGEHIIVTGTYPPIIKCYTVSDLAMKFQRGLTCEVIAFETLSDDFGKLVFLQSDRTVNFHAPYGTHYNVRIPKFGRDLVYNWNNCDLYLGASGNEIYRLNLETGQFREPFELSYSGCNKLHINPMHGLLACGGENATCEFWDPRSRKSVSKLVVDSLKSIEITALKFDTDGLTLGVGTSHGNSILYDIRSEKPLYTKEHQYGLPIVNITYHTTSTNKYIISTDKKLVKIWERNEPNQGNILTNIETPGNINDILVVEDKKCSSGLIMMTGEQTRVMTYFIPNLGHAPKWCSFLDSLTEELEESGSQNVYEDYKFITQKEVEELGATTLIGTPLLKGYMHGYFIEIKLYNKLRAVSKPFEYEEYRLSKIKDKINEKRSSRITPRKRLPKVNKQLAEKLLFHQNANNKKNSNGTSSTSNNPEELVDDRFAALFKREDFQQDETSSEFILRNPTAAQRKKFKAKNGDDDDENEDLYQDNNSNNNGSNNRYTNDDDEDYDDYDDDDDSNNDDEEDDEDEYTYQKSSNKNNKKPKNTNNNNSNTTTNNDDDEDEGAIQKATKRVLLKKTQMNHSNSKSSYNSKTRQRCTPKMTELPSGMSSSKIIFEKYKNNNNNRSSSSNSQDSNLPITKRLSNFNSSTANNSNNGRINKNKTSTVHTDKHGVMREISFIPKADTKGQDKKRIRQDTTTTTNNNIAQQPMKGSRLDRERAHFIN